MCYIQQSSVEDFIVLETYFFRSREWVQFTGEKSHDGIILDRNIYFE